MTDKLTIQGMIAAVEGNVPDPEEAEGGRGVEDLMLGRKTVGTYAELNPSHDEINRRIIEAEKRGRLAGLEEAAKMFDGLYFGPFSHPSAVIRARKSSLEGGE